jgi:hypothetical protein
MSYREVAREFVDKYNRQLYEEADVRFLLRSTIWVNGTGYWPMAALKLYKQFKKEFACPKETLCQSS